MEITVDGNNLDYCLDNLEHYLNYASVVDDLQKSKESIIEWITNYKNDADSVIKEAKEELVLSGIIFKDNAPILDIVNALQVLKVMESQKHSNYGFEFTRNIIDNILKGIPLTPLTAEDSEWGDPQEFNDVKLYRNLRYPHVIKKEYYIDGELNMIEYFDITPVQYKLPNGNIITDNNSIVHIESFPYIPSNSVISVKID